jgi:outer membrane protein assembly factor BamB
MSNRRLAVAGTACLLATPAATESPVNWPQFRGTDGAGIADSSRLPTRWSATENVAWTAEVPGRGWSSPIVWGARVYVTTAVNAGRFKAPPPGSTATTTRMS